MRAVPSSATPSWPPPPTTAPRASATSAASSSPATTSPSASSCDRRLEAEGWEQAFAGEIVGLVGGGLFIRFGEVFEGFLSSRRLGGERMEVSEHGTALVGEASGTRYRLGDPVEVKVERVDRLTGKVDLAPVLPAGDRPVTGPNRRPARRTTGSRPPRRRGPGSETRRKNR